MVRTRDNADFVAAWRAGEAARGRELGNRLATLAAALFAEPNPCVIKGVLHAQGKIPSPAVRLPLLPARDDTVHAAMGLLGGPQLRELNRPAVTLPHPGRRRRGGHMATAVDGTGHGEPAGGPRWSGRAWLAALPDELAAQRRVMAGLAERCAAWPLAASLLVGCSLGRGAADALSDIDAALGVDAPPGEAGAERVGTVAALVAAALPELGPLVDVLRHPTGAADHRSADLRPVRRRYPARPGGRARGRDRRPPPPRRRPRLRAAV